MMIPRSKRDRLTRKQIAHMDKPDLATDLLDMAQEVKVKKSKATFVVVDPSDSKEANKDIIFSSGRADNNSD